MYSIVCPIKPFTSHKFILCFFKQIEKYLIRSDKFDTFYIITSSIYYNEILPYIKDLNIFKNINFVDESSLLNNNIYSDNNYKIEGWQYQQILKLLISYIINTPYYLVIDIDMFLIKELDFDHLFYDNKIMYIYEPFPFNNPPGYTNNKWWSNSSKLLDFDVENLYPMQDLMGVTPQLLVTSIVNELVDYLNKKDEKWHTKPFTEFSLYWIFILKKGYKKLYTTQGTHLLNVDNDYNIMDRDINFNKIKSVVMNAKKYKKYHFLLIQSWINILFYDDSIYELINN